MILLKRFGIDVSFEISYYIWCITCFIFTDNVVFLFPFDWKIKRPEPIWKYTFDVQNHQHLLSFSECFNTGASCRKTNLTSHLNILTIERKFNELSSKWFLIAERKLSSELRTLMLTTPPMKHVLWQKPLCIMFDKIT